jgi:hypothetical protein
MSNVNEIQNWYQSDGPDYYIENLKTEEKIQIDKIFEANLNDLTQENQSLSSNANTEPLNDNELDDLECNLDALIYSLEHSNDEMKNEAVADSKYSVIEDFIKKYSN